LIEKTKILIAAGEQSGTVALAIVLHAKHRADAGTLSAASNPMYGASVRIPMKVARAFRDEVARGPVPLLADKFVASGAVILALEPRAWAQQAAGERALGRRCSKRAACRRLVGLARDWRGTGLGSTKQAHREAAGAFFERRPLCRYPRFRSQRFWHPEEDAFAEGCAPQAVARRD
jgi:hypothetical protein